MVSHLRNKVNYFFLAVFAVAFYAPLAHADTFDTTACANNSGFYAQQTLGDRGGGVLVDPNFEINSASFYLGITGGTATGTVTAMLYQYYSSTSAPIATSTNSHYISEAIDDAYFTFTFDNAYTVNNSFITVILDNTSLSAGLDLTVGASTCTTDTILNGALIEFDDWRFEVANGFQATRTVLSVVDYNLVSESCLTCTRIISTDPGQETVATTTSRDYYIDYYLASTDYLEGNTYLEMSYQHTLATPLDPNYYNTYSESFTSNIFTTGYDTKIFNLAQTYVPGTYNVSIRIYQLIEPPWWNFWADSYQVDLVTYATYFHAGSYTTAEEIETVQTQAEQSWYFTNWGEPSSIKSFIDGYVDTILHGAPVGYATRIYEMFSATSSTSTTISITHVFPTSTPVSGKSLTLDISGGADFAIAMIGPDNYERFMTIWNFMWYSLLILWILKEVFGTFNFSMERHPDELKS